MVKISTEMDPEFYKRFRVKLAQDGVKSAVIVRAAIEAYVTGKWVPNLDTRPKERKPIK